MPEIAVEMLVAKGATVEQIRSFCRAFPDGLVWENDERAKAIASGPGAKFDVHWMVRALLTDEGFDEYVNAVRPSLREYVNAPKELWPDYDDRDSPQRMALFTARTLAFLRTYKKEATDA